MEKLIFNEAESYFLFLHLDYSLHVAIMLSMLRTMLLSPLFLSGTVKMLLPMQKIMPRIIIHITMHSPAIAQILHHSVF